MYPIYLMDQLFGSYFSIKQLACYVYSINLGRSALPDLKWSCVVRSDGDTNKPNQCKGSPLFLIFFWFFFSSSSISSLLSDSAATHSEFFFFSGSWIFLFLSLGSSFGFGIGDGGTVLLCICSWSSISLESLHSLIIRVMRHSTRTHSIFSMCQVQKPLRCISNYNRL